MRDQIKTAHDPTQRQSPSRVRPKQIAFDLDISVKYLRILIRKHGWKHKRAQHWIFTEKEAREIKRFISDLYSEKVR